MTTGCRSRRAAACRSPSPRAAAAQPRGGRTAKPAPGVLRLRVGDVVVTALLDGNVSLPLTLFPAPARGGGETPSWAARLAATPPNIAVNAFLVQAAGARC
jgi:hypothetical protein